MTRQEIHIHFIAFMETERIKRNLTIGEMAELLRLPVSTYKNVIYGKSECIDIAIACRLYDLTHRWMFEMCGYETSESKFLDDFARLSEHDKNTVRMITAVLSCPEV